MYAWKKAAVSGFEAFFARRSEPLNLAAEKEPLIEVSGTGSKWLFSFLGDEPVQVSVASGGRVRNVALAVTGALATLGVGAQLLVMERARTTGLSTTWRCQQAQ